MSLVTLCQYCYMYNKTKLKEFAKNCPQCGGEQLYNGKRTLRDSIRRNTVCISCARRVYKYPKYEEIPVYWVELKKENARIRKWEWNLTVEYIWDIYVAQNKVCALSGVEIGFPIFGRKSTASIDRIDPEIGYIPGNVQLVHKDVNRMKSFFKEDYFIEMCKKIAKRNKEQI